MKNFLITIDYELFGDGSGDVFEDVIKPTEHILKAADRYGVKLTFFYEWLEFRRLQEMWDSGEHMGYKDPPVAAVQAQIGQALRNGHDVQLHIHPQWQISDFTEGKWHVDANSCRLSDFVPASGMTSDWMLKTGKAEMEAIFRPFKPDYQCIAFRAGYYNADPGKKYIDQLKRYGFQADSSVYTGGVENGMNRYDYSTVTNEKGYWWTDRDIREADGCKSGICELPIMALPLPKIRKYLQWKKIVNALRNVHRANSTLDHKLDHNKSHGILSKFAFFFGKEFQTWDICIISDALQKRFLREVKRLDTQFSRDTFVLIGHSKGYKNNPRGIDFLLKQLAERTDCRCITISDFLANESNS